MNLFLLVSLLVAGALAVPGSRIIGGNVATRGQFPFAAALQITKPTGRYFCSGSLITTKWILTAAQCAEGATSFFVVMGQPNLKNESDGSQTSVATEYHVHPDYNPSTLYADVAVILLPEEISWTYSAKALQGFLEMKDDAPYTAVGWGHLNDEALAISDDLHHASLIVLNNLECQTNYYGSQLHETMACARGAANEGICTGDSGSPLIYDQYGIIYQVGIASFLSANGCASTDPSGYTRVHPYHRWISNVTNSHNSNLPDE